MNHLSPLPPEGTSAAAAGRSDSAGSEIFPARPAGASRLERMKPFDSHLHPAKKRAQPSDEERLEKIREKRKSQPEEVDPALAAGLIVPPASPDPAAIASRPPGSRISDPSLTNKAPGAQKGAEEPVAQGAKVPADAEKSEAAKNSASGEETPPAPPAAEETAAASAPEKPLRMGVPGSGGTNAAKQHPEMSFADSTHKEKSNALEGSALPAEAESATSSSARPGPERDLARNFGQNDADSHSSPETSALLRPESSLPSLRTAEPAQKAAATEQVGRFFNELGNALQHLRTDGRSNVEVGIKLRDGSELTVRLQIQAGAVRATFKTDSSEWREAIARGWANFSNSTAQHGLKVALPVFESTGAQDSLHDFNHRQGRREETESPVSEPSFPQSTPSKETKSTLAPAPHSTAPAPKGWMAWA